MPAFRFEAIDAAGKAQKGVLDADSARGARTNLRSQGLTPLVVEPAASRTRGERNQRLSLGRRLSQREQAILTRQLASLLIAGLPLPILRRERRTGISNVFGGRMPRASLTPAHPASA